MRASKKASPTTNKKGTKAAELHISGAEGIFNESEILQTSAGLIRRALSHPRGKPDQIVITVEKIEGKTSNAVLLPVSTLECNSPDEAWEIIVSRLTELGVSARALKTAMMVLKSEKTMRGAALVSIRTGKRMEPDHSRGVRVSRVGIEKSSEKKLSRSLAKSKINTSTVREAIIIASKVAASSHIFAEICISDDPDYTTGYIASGKFGYIRIPNIKSSGRMSGGRVFFVRENADIDRLIAYLERNPVILKFGK